MVLFVNSPVSKQFAWGISLGAMHWSAHALPFDRQQPSIEKQDTDKHVPASVLLNRTVGEPFKLDYWSPPHPRGTAASWPPEAAVHREMGSGRFPIAAAWTGRNNDANRVWQWRIDGEAHELTSLDAIARGVSQLTKIHAKDFSSSIVIPNDFRQREQQKLLDACSALGADASLIWLPIAAALAWLEQEQVLLALSQSRSDDPLILPIVHADWGEIRCSTIALVPRDDNNRRRWIPARKRPIISDWSTPGFGWSEAASCDASNCQTVWRRLFTSSIQAINADSTVTQSNILEQIANWSLAQSTNQQVDRSLAEHLSSIPLPASILFVGDFAAQVSRGRNVLRQTVPRHLGQAASFVYDGVAGENLLALGAAIFARDRAERRISYLDTLPGLELFVDRNHQYDWLSLLGDTDQFVPGGQQWELPQPIEGLALRRGATSVKLVLAHEEYPGVRELQVPLERPVELDLAARLHVSATPAQGNAKLRLLTESHGSIPAREIQANWDRMIRLFDGEDLPIGKEAYTKSRPRAFPNLRPRPADAERWNAFEGVIKKYFRSAHVEDDFISSPSYVRQLLEAARVASGRFALSSDGRVPPEENQSIVDNLTKSIFGYVSSSTRPRQGPTYDELVKLLGFMSADCEGLDVWIRGEITKSPKTGEAICILAGNCIRDPKSASIFVRRLLDEIPLGNLQRLLNYQMQALGRLLSQRQDATRELRLQDANLLVEQCLNVFADEIEKDKLAWLFEHSGLVVVYALRYRIYDQTFLDPDSQLALRAKELFAIAIKKLAERRDRRYRYGNGGNFVSPERAERLLAALKQLIDYIDKRGEGDILIAID